MTTYRRLSGSDAIFIYMETPDAFNHTLKISVLDPSTDPDGWSWDGFMQHCRDTIHLVPIWRQRCLKTPFGLHFPIWVDDPNFDIEYHIRRIGCPQPGGKREFCQLVSEIYSRPLDIRRPLWQMWVIEGLERDQVAIVTLIHHAYTDGVGVLPLMDMIQAKEPNASYPPATEAWNPPPLPSLSRRLLWGLKDLPGLLANNLGPFMRGWREGRRVTGEMKSSGQASPPSPRDRSIPMPFSYALISPHRQFSCRSFALADLRLVSKSLQCTINDAFVSCVSGAVRRYLKEQGESVDKSTLGSIPMNLVPLEERTSLGNYSVIEHTALCIDVDDPMERLRATVKACNVTKEYHRATRDANLSALFNLLHPYVGKLMGWINRELGGRIFPISNIVLSNVPGPREKRYVRGWEVAEWYSTGQVNHGVALNITVWSYADQFNLCVLTDRAHLTDTWKLADYFEQELHELLRLSRDETGATG